MTRRKQTGRVARTRKRRKSQQSRVGVIEFYHILDMLPSRLRPYFVVLALTGLRIGELFAMRPEDLDHEVRGIRVKSAKTTSGVQKVYVAREFWPWVMATVPVPVSYRHLRDNWSAAVERAGFKKVTLSGPRLLRSRLLAEANVEFGVIRLVFAGPDENRGLEAVLDRRSQEEARLLVQAFQVLALTEEAGRRLLVRRIPD